MKEVKWITKNGVHIPITNKYMNEMIRNKKTNFAYKEDSEELRKKLDEDTKQTMQNLTTDEEKSLIGYTGYTYKEITETLVYGEPKEYKTFKNLNEINDDINLLDNVMAKSTIKENIITYNGTTSYFFGSPEVGDEIEIGVFSPVVVYVLSAINNGIPGSKSIS